MGHSAEAGRRPSASLQPVAESRSRVACLPASREHAADVDIPVLSRLKLQPPPLHGVLIERSSPRAQLSEARAAVVTLVQAPAGYGRTTLLAQWFRALRQDGKAAWLTLEAAEADPCSFLRYVVAALGSTGIDLSTLQAHLPALQGIADAALDAAADDLITRLANCLSEIADPVYLVLDDAHHIAQGAALPCLRRLIAMAPPSLHLLLSSRRRLDLPLGRLRASSHLLELDSRDLRLTADELVQYLHRSGWHGIDPEIVKVIDSRTEGWLTGLKLLDAAQRHERRPGAALQSFDGGQRTVAEFFDQEVWAELPDAIRDFVLKTSVLDSLCVPLCDALVGRRGSRHTLERCMDLGVFLSTVDESGASYRYHGLFTEYLRRKLRELSPQEADVLVCRVCEWLQGEIPVLMHVATRAVSAGEMQQAQNIRAMLAIAWPLCLAWQFDCVEDLLRGSRHRLRELARNGELAAHDQRALEAQLAFVDVVLKFCQDEVGSLDARILDILRQYDDVISDLIKGSLHALLIATRREQFKLDNVDRYEALSRQLILRSSVAPHALVTLSALVGPALYGSGRTEAALKCLHAGLEQTLNDPHHGIPLHQMIALPMAAIHYERNELARATELIARYLPHCTEFGFCDQLLAGWLTQARLLRHRGDLQGALRTLDELNAAAVRFGFDRVRLMVGAERIRFLQAGGQAEFAADVGRELGLPESPAAVKPAEGATSLDEARALVWTRLALSEGRIDDGVWVAERWRGFFDARRVAHCLIGWGVLLTHLHVLHGDMRSARRVLHDTLARASAGRFIRTIIDEGPAIGELVLEQARPPVRAPSLREAFDVEIHAAFELELSSRKPQQPLDSVMAEFNGALSARERELLELVAARLTNREIGDRFGMSEASVKWSLQQIFDKIGVRKRSEAAERARRFGLIC